MSGGEVALLVIGVIAGLAILFGLFVMLTYNKFVRQKNDVEEAFSTMDVYLKKRYDLIPNLVETVKGYAKHEKEALENVMKARYSAMNAGSTNEKVKGENALSSTLKSLFKVTENYPELKADKHFSELMGQLKEVENEIVNARKYYNGTVKMFNTKCDVFPSSIIARWFKFQKLDLFEVADAEERQNVKVQF